MIGPEDIAALQDTLLRGLVTGMVVPHWHGHDGHAAFSLAPGRSLRVWSPALPVPAEAFGNRRAEPFCATLRVLAGRLAVHWLTPQPDRNGHFGIFTAGEGQDHTRDDDAARYSIRIEQIEVIHPGRANTGRPELACPLFSGLFHECRPMELPTVALVAHLTERPGRPRILAPLDGFIPPPPAPLAGPLANAVRDVLAGLDAKAWQTLAAAAFGFRSSLPSTTNAAT